MPIKGYNKGECSWCKSQNEEMCCSKRLNYYWNTPTVTSN